MILSGNDQAVLPTQNLVGEANRRPCSAILAGIEVADKPPGWVMFVKTTDQHADGSGREQRGLVGFTIWIIVEQAGRVGRSRKFARLPTGAPVGGDFIGWRSWCVS